jgi:MSHA biogenesis protein MshJ
MNGFKEQFQAIMNRIDEMSLRERGLLLGAFVVLVLIIWNETFLNPLDKQKDALNTQVEQKRKTLETLEQQVNTILARQKQDPNKENRASLQRLQQQAEALDEQLQSLTVDLIDPVKMARVLEEVLDRETSLVLEKVATLGATSLLEEVTGAQDKTSKSRLPPGVYRHGLVMVLRGSYMDTLRYLTALEALPRGLYWNEIHMELQEYPTVRVTLHVHTLSLDQDWIGI